MITYLSHSAGARWFDYLFFQMLSKIPKKSIRSVADIGCGLGLKTATMAHYFPKAEVYGYDFSKPGINAAKQKFMTLLKAVIKYKLVTVLN